MKVKQKYQWIRKLIGSALPIFVIAGFLPLPAHGYCILGDGPIWGGVTLCTGETPTCSDVRNFYPDGTTPMLFQCVYVDINSKSGCTIDPSGYSGITEYTNYSCPLSLGETACLTDSDHLVSSDTVPYFGQIANTCP